MGTAVQEAKPSKEQKQDQRKQAQRDHYDALGKKLIKAIKDKPGIRRPELLMAMGFGITHIANIIRWVNERDAESQRQAGENHKYPLIVLVGKTRGAYYILREDQLERDRIKEELARLPPAPKLQPRRRRRAGRPCSKPCGPFS